jgi:(+)-trans-carveol dehydrogenase
MAELTDRVALVTGAARGQGRSHAVRLAEAGVDVIALDLCAQVATVSYPMPTRRDLDETVAAVETTGRRIVGIEADVRDVDQMRQAVDEGIRHLGRLDFVCANAGIASYGAVHELSVQEWDDVIAINLTGVWATLRAAVPHLIEGGNGAPS